VLQSYVLPHARSTPTFPFAPTRQVLPCYALHPIDHARAGWRPIAPATLGPLLLVAVSSFARHWVVLSPEAARRPAAVKMNHFHPVCIARCPVATESDEF
jgi:hypothetical protein